MWLLVSTERAEPGGGVAAFETSLGRAVAVPGPREREVDPGLGDDLHEPRAATRAMLSESRVEVAGVPEVLACMPVGTLEVK